MKSTARGQIHSFAGFFRVMRIPLLRVDNSHPPIATRSEGGRRQPDFREAVLAKTNPIGTFVSTYPNLPGVPDSREIVGVVGDVIDHVGQRTTVAQLYLPFLQSPPSAMVVVIRGGDPATLTPAVRESIGLWTRTSRLAASRQ